MPVVNSTLSSEIVQLTQPNPWGYIFIVAEVDPESVTTEPESALAVPVDPRETSASAQRAALYGQLEALRPALTGIADVRSVSFFEAMLFAPGSLDKFASRGGSARPARYDTVILIETDSPADAELLLAHGALDDFVNVVREGSSFTKVFTATNAKKTREVDRGRAGVFLFNFFFAEDVNRLLDIWDRTAGWWQTEGKMANSELLRPTAQHDSEYAIINNARWDDAAPAVAAFLNPHYWEFVLANIDANGATAMPSLYRVFP